MSPDPIDNTSLLPLNEHVISLTGLTNLNQISRATILPFDEPQLKPLESSPLSDDLILLSVLFLILPIVAYLAYAWGKWKGRKESPKEIAINLYKNQDRKKERVSPDDESTNEQSSDGDASPHKPNPREEVYITDDNVDRNVPDLHKKESESDSYASESPSVSEYPRLNFLRDNSNTNSPAQPFMLNANLNNDKPLNELNSTSLALEATNTFIPVRKTAKVSMSSLDPGFDETVFGEKFNIVQEPKLVVQKSGNLEIQVETMENGNIRKKEITEVITEYSSEIMIEYPKIAVFLQDNDDSSIGTMGSITSSTQADLSRNKSLSIYKHLQSKSPGITQSDSSVSNCTALVPLMKRAQSDTSGSSPGFFNARSFPAKYPLELDNSNMREIDEIYHELQKRSTPTPTEQSKHSETMRSSSKMSATQNSDPKEKNKKDSNKKSEQGSMQKNKSPAAYSTADERHIQIQRLVEEYDLPDETGKFEKVFKNPDSIGSGSFGEVFKVTHRVDGKLYAVKKVKLRLGRFDDLQKESKVFREVFAMTDLHHPNIVRYSTCWVEIDSKALEEKKERARRAVSLEGISESSESEKSYEQDDQNENDDLIQFADSRASSSNICFDRGDVESKAGYTKTEQSRSRTLTRKLQKKSSGKINKVTKSINENSEESLASQSLSMMSNYSGISKIDPRFVGIKLYLYIQMEFCSGLSLRTYLDNPKREIVIPTVLEMFRKLLEGVRMIHSHGILHRDLKPANIFLDEHGNVKIGDFGLASLEKMEDQEISDNNKGLNLFTNNKNGNVSHSMKVGTPLYTSPEQEKGGSYDHKTDIYSLGLIFCEMLCVFGTTHERYQLLTKLREKQELPDSIFKKFGNYEEGLKELILKMTRKAPRDRPSAEELIKDVDGLKEKK